MPTATTFKLLALLALLGAAVFTDIRDNRIPNRVTVGGALVGTVLTAVESSAFPTGAFLGIAVALGLGFPLFALRAVGAGDVKLLAAVGAFMGPGALLSVVLYGGVAGGILGLGSAVRRGVILPILLEARNLVVYLITLGRHGRRRTLDDPEAHTVPYGVAIAVGAVAAWLFPISLGGGL
ncbi:MAG: prepilin peptidase [Gemmatimonadota bacterium]|jgi:prepilin peptidase CpaA